MFRINHNLLKRNNIYSLLQTAFFSESTAARLREPVDALIIGGGPAGLSAAIRLRQLCPDSRIILLEKGSYIGAHTLSGAVISTAALDELLPNWKNLNSPIKQKVTRDKFRWLTESRGFELPHPPQLDNVKEGNYIVSLSQVVKWLGDVAEEIGVEVYPGFPAAQVIYNKERNGVIGVATKEVGISKSGEKKSNFEEGMEFVAPITLFAEGAHGSLTKELIQTLQLRKGVQTYAIGLKEVWEVDNNSFEAGLVYHSMGWPMDYKTYGGGFLYCMQEGDRKLVSVGFVIALDYQNPYMNPYKEFQRYKHHPEIANYLKGGKCISYGARALNEGGYQSIPKLDFQGGALIGCSAGFLNVPRIKGTHYAMKSGILAAESAAKRLKEAEGNEMKEGSFLLDDYEKNVFDSYIGKDLYAVRNIRPSFNTPLGVYGGVMWSGIDTYLLKGRSPWTFKHSKADHAYTKKANESTLIKYPKPDGTLSFDLLTSVSRTGTYHSEDQPNHLRLKDPSKSKISLEEYAAPESRFCPAGVYEYVNKELVINSQNCIHCKTCDIKDVNQNIDWTVPEGSGGPKYTIN